MKQIIFNSEEKLPEEDIFLVNPIWDNLDEKEIRERLEKGEKLFKVKIPEV